MKTKKILSLLTAATLSVSAFAGLATTASAADPVTIYEIGTSGVAWTEEEKGNWVPGDSYSTVTLNETASISINGGNGARTATKTITAPTDNSIVNVSVLWNNGTTTGGSGNYTYFQIGNNISFRAYGQDTYGSIFVGETEYKSYELCKKNVNRDNDDWTINLTVDTAKNVITNLSITSASGKNTFAPTDEGNIVLPVGSTFSTLTFGSIRVRNSVGGSTLKSVKVTETAQEVQTANYTVKYLLDGTETAVKTEETRSGVVGNTIALASGDTANFKADDKKYIYVSNDNSAEKTIAADGSTVVNVYFREADVYDIKVVPSTDEENTFYSGNVFEGDSYSYAYPKYITNAQNKVVAEITTPGSYSVTASPTKSEVITIPYTNHTGNDMWVVEAEAAIPSKTDATSANFSGGHARRSLDGVGYETITVAEDGVYTINFAGSMNRTDKTYGFNVYRNEATDSNVVLTASGTFSAALEVKVTTAENVVLSAGDKLIVKGTHDSNSIFDYIAIEKTGNAVSGTPQILSTVTGTGDNAADTETLAGYKDPAQSYDENKVATPVVATFTVPSGVKFTKPSIEWTFTYTVEGEEGTTKKTKTTVFDSELTGTGEEVKYGIVVAGANFAAAKISASSAVMTEGSAE